MSEEKIIEKSNDYIRLFEKGYCSECNELCSIDNFPNEDLKKLLYAWQSLYKQEKEKNNELFEEYNKRVNTIIKYEQGIKEFIDETHITDIEPWSIYKINGGLLFNLEQLLEEE